MTKKWNTLTKKELIELLEPYNDNTNIIFAVNLKQGYVGFFDLEEDENANREEFILTSKALDNWYKEDMEELRFTNDEIEMLKQQIEEKNNYQRLLESKIIRLKDRVKTFEKNYSLKDIERYKQMDNPNMITHKRLWGVKRHE